MDYDWVPTFVDLAEAARNDLVSALQSPTLDALEAVNGRYTDLAVAIERDPSRLGLTFRAMFAILQKGGSMESLLASAEAQYARGVLEGRLLQLSGRPNPDPATSVDSLRESGLALRKEGDLLLANLQELFRLGRTLGYTGNYDGIIRTLEQVRTMKPS